MKFAALRKNTEAENHGMTTEETESSKASGAVTPDTIRPTIDEAYDATEKHMLESIPWPKVTSNVKRKRSERQNARVCCWLSRDSINQIKYVELL